MRPVKTSFAASVLAALTTSTAAMAQSYYDDQACRQYANQQVAAIQGQANAQAFGSTLLGAGLGAAIGGAVGGGRGAGIGAASGAVLGGATGVANAQNTAAYAPQQYNAYYSQCMAAAPPRRRPITRRRRLTRRPKDTRRARPAAPRLEPAATQPADHGAAISAALFAISAVSAALLVGP